MPGRATTSPPVRPKSATDATNIVTWKAYDLRGNLTEEIEHYISGGAIDAQTNVTTYDGFDALGRQVSETDPRGYVTEIDYDADGRATSKVQNYVSGGAYDLQNNVTTTTVYDKAGNAVQTQDSGCAYNLNNPPHYSLAVAGCKLTNTTYDQDNRATEVIAEDGTGALSQDTQTAYFADGKTQSTTQVALPGSGGTDQTTSYIY